MWSHATPKLVQFTTPTRGIAYEVGDKVGLSTDPTQGPELVVYGTITEVVDIGLRTGLTVELDEDVDEDVLIRDDWLYSLLHNADG